MPPTRLGAPLALLLIAGAAAPGAAQGPSAAQSLSPPAPQVGGRFGQSVAVTATRLFVGAPGVDGAAPGGGAVYVFEPTGSTGWSAVAELTPATGAAGDDFGRALSAQADLLAVGSPGVAVYLFERDPGGSWSELQRLLPGDDARASGFGGDLDLSGNQLLVGAPERLVGAGAAYLFERDPVSERFELRQVLLPSHPQADANFGQRVALAGELAAVSAPGQRVPDGPLGQQSVGAAYLFARTGAGRFTQLQLLAPDYPEPIEEYGADLDLDATTVVIGAPRRDLPGMNGAGAALLLEPNAAAGAWLPVRELIASNAQADDGFGEAVAIRGDVVLVGAPDTAFGGAVYAFGRDVGGPGAWGQFGRIDNPTGLGDFFGAAVDLETRASLVGSPFADSGSLSAAGAATVVVGLDRPAGN